MNRRYRIRAHYYLYRKPASIFTPENERKMMATIDSFKWGWTAKLFCWFYRILNKETEQYASIWVEKPKNSGFFFKKNQFNIRAKDGL